jgi:hypothetical protein
VRSGDIAWPAWLPLVDHNQLGKLYPEHTIPDTGLGLSAGNWRVMPRLSNELYLAIDVVPIFDEESKLIAVVETLRDMTDQKRAEKALKNLAASDGLTGLANRRSFDQSLAMEWSHRYRDADPAALARQPYRWPESVRKA